MEAEVTIVITERESYSPVLETLDQLYEVTDVPFELVYVESGAPRSIRRYLTEQARVRGFRLMSADSRLPQRAKNLGLSLVRTEFAVVMDNDVHVYPGWLRALLSCARETGAWVVAPVYLQGNPRDEEIHQAGGEMRIDGAAVERVMTYIRRPRADVAAELHRRECGLMEFHCFLVRMSAFEHIGPLDERMVTMEEDMDLALALRAVGGTIWFEPDSKVCYTGLMSSAPSDVRLRWRRWSEAWLAASERNFRDKWGLTVSSEDRTSARWRRRAWWATTLLGRIERIAGRQVRRGFTAVLFPIERALNSLMVRAPRRAGLRPGVSPIAEVPTGDSGSDV